MPRALLTALIIIGALVSLASCKKPANAPAAQAQAPAKDPNESLARFDKGEFRVEVSITSEPSFSGKETLQVMETKKGNIRIEMSVERIGKTVDIVRKAEKKVIQLDVAKKEASVYYVSGAPDAAVSQIEAARMARTMTHWKKSADGKYWVPNGPKSKGPLEITEYWMDGPGGLPSKLVLNAAGLKMTEEFKYVKVGGIPDSDFEIPKGYKVTKKELPKPSTDR